MTLACLLALSLTVVPIVADVPVQGGPPQGVETTAPQLLPASDASSSGEATPVTIADTLTLDDLVRSASALYPRRREQQARSAIAQGRLANLDTRFKTQLNLSSQAAYHSQVPSLPSGLGASPSQDQYDLSVSAEQLLWDGGRTAREKAIEEASRDLDLATVNTDFMDWRTRVESAYFQVLSADIERELLDTLVADLAAQLKIFEARVKAGVALAGDRAALAAELEGQRQRSIEVAADRRTALDLMAAFTGRTLADDVRLVMPDAALDRPAEEAARVYGVDSASGLLDAAVAAASGQGVGRPEMEQARATQRLLQERLALAGLARKPEVSAFARGGVGRPADQDFFETDPAPYVVLGLKFRWRLLDWGVTGREQEVRRLDREIAASRLETFLRSLSAGLVQIAHQIDATRQLLASDSDIIGLRQESARQAAAQLRAGVVTPTAYLLERNAEHRARVTREQHRLRLARQTVVFFTTLGAAP